MIQNCSFCFQPDIIYCMNRSVHHKHSQQDDRSYKIIDQLLENEGSANYLRYKEIIMKSDQRQFLSHQMKGKQLTKQYLDLLEYYKFRCFVPIFSKSFITDRIMTYYYDKLKHYYNGIKRELHITVENSSTSILRTYTNQTETDESTKKEVLKDLKKELEEEEKKKTKKKVNSITNFKSESKALEELVSYLKLNPQFEKIKTLKTQDCFEEQQIFQETTLKKSVIYHDHHHNSVQTNVKNKLFKKIIEESTPTTKNSVYHQQIIKERPKSRSKSIKIIKFKETKDKEKGNEKRQTKMKLATPKVKGTISTKTLPGRNISLEKINQNNYISSYKKKSFSSDKNKITTAIISKQRNSVQSLKIRQFDEGKKSRDSILTTQLLKFQNATPYRSTPNSPSGRKTPRPQIKVTKTDNILTIRKKKLQALREKTSQK